MAHLELDRAVASNIRDLEFEPPVISDLHWQHVLYGKLYLGNEKTRDWDNKIDTFLLEKGTKI